MALWTGSKAEAKIHPGWKYMKPKSHPVLSKIWTLRSGGGDEAEEARDEENENLR